MEEKIDQFYTLPRDWWKANSYRGLLTGLGIAMLVGAYKLYNFMRADIASGMKYTSREVLTSLIVIIVIIAINFLLLYLIFRSLKKNTIKLTSQEIIINTKKHFQWSDLQGYSKKEDKIILITKCIDKVSSFISGNQDYVREEFHAGKMINEVEGELKKFIVEIPYKEVLHKPT